MISELQRYGSDIAHRVRAVGRLAILACLASSVTAVTADTSAEDTKATEGKNPRLFDPVDGKFDVSGFLDTAYGFVPLLVPITEPAVGYGAVAALVFIDQHERAAGEKYVRPNIAVAGGMRTENGTNGLFAAHLGTWRDGDLRTLAAVADIDVNLEFYGIGADRLPGEGLDYSVSARGGAAGASWRAGDTQFWLGARYSAINTDVSLDVPNLPDVSDADFGLKLGGLTPSITFDLRDNFFTPTHGWYVDLSVPVYRESLGSDRDFETYNLTGMYFRPFRQSLFLGLRASVRGSSDDTPFFLRPFISLRGVQAMRYQGKEAAEIEAELRWQFKLRFSLVGFAGTGMTRSAIGDNDDSVVSGGAGFRYLVARRYGLHMGLDLAAGPDGGAIYVVFGNAWLRP